MGTCSCRPCRLCRLYYLEIRHPGRNEASCNSPLKVELATLLDLECGRKLHGSQTETELKDATASKVAEPEKLQLQPPCQYQMKALQKIESEPLEEKEGSDWNSGSDVPEAETSLLEARLRGWHEQKNELFKPSRLTPESLAQLEQEHKNPETTDFGPSLDGIWCFEDEPVAIVTNLHARFFGDDSGENTPIAPCGNGVFLIALDEEEHLGDVQSGPDGKLTLFWSDGATWVRQDGKFSHQEITEFIAKAGIVLPPELNASGTPDLGEAEDQGTRCQGTRTIKKIYEESGGSSSSSSSTSSTSASSSSSSSSDVDLAKLRP